MAGQDVPGEEEFNARGSRPWVHRTTSKSAKFRFCKLGFATANMSGFNLIVGLLFVVNWGHGW
ncbi:Hypothetical predicted protein, partial [Olea europaea subsp. europaea]